MDDKMKIAIQIPNTGLEEDILRKGEWEDDSLFGRSLRNALMNFTKEPLEQEPCGDIITFKQAVLDTISELNAISFYEAQEASKECYYEIRQAIENMSPVIPAKDSIMVEVGKKYKVYSSMKRRLLDEVKVWEIIDSVFYCYSTLSNCDTVYDLSSGIIVEQIESEEADEEM